MNTKTHSKFHEIKNHVLPVWVFLLAMTLMHCQRGAAAEETLFHSDFTEYGPDHELGADSGDGAWRFLSIPASTGSAQVQKEETDPGLFLRVQQPLDSEVKRGWSLVSHWDESVMTGSSNVLKLRFWFRVLQSPQPVDCIFGLIETEPGNAVSNAEFVGIFRTLLSANEGTFEFRYWQAGETGDEGNYLSVPSFEGSVNEWYSFEAVFDLPSSTLSFQIGNSGMEDLVRVADVRFQARSGAITGLAFKNRLMDPKRAAFFDIKDVNLSLKAR